MVEKQLGEKGKGKEWLRLLEELREGRSVVGIE